LVEARQGNQFLHVRIVHLDLREDVLADGEVLPDPL